jgi:uncharacterized membrane protein YfhO
VVAYRIQGKRDMLQGPDGWSARAGGRALPTLHVDGAFLGVRLPAGVSRLELRFLPPGFVAGCAALGLALTVLLFLLLPDRKPRREAPYI